MFSKMVRLSEHHQLTLRQAWVFLFKNQFNYEQARSAVRASRYRIVV